MSIVKSNHQIYINGETISVNDSDPINDTNSGIPGTVNTLHDQTIEEKKGLASDATNIENEEDNNKPNRVNLIDIYLLKQNSMAIYYGWQIVCLIIFIFTAYETLQSVLPKGERYPEPRRFFSTDSFVQDYPYGNLGVVQKKVALSDLSFCVFYAPWSADSQHARPTIEVISKRFYREANFMAINCWQPDGECRIQYKKVMSWPVLMAYSRNIAVPYNGQWTESALARFVYLMLRPLHRISKPDELLEIMMRSDAVVTLFVNMDTGHTFYNIFYQAATKWLEKDPQGDVAFVVVTGETMKQFGIEREPSLRMYFWNRTVEYEDEVWKASLIHKWIVQSKQQVTQWLAPPGSRSKEFDAFVTKGPVLVLFTPRNLYDFSSDAYAMLRQIGYEYYNCGNDAWLTEMGRTYIYNQRKINIRNYYLQTKECELFAGWKNSVENKCLPSLGRHSFAGIGNSSKSHYNAVRSKGSVNEYCENLPKPYEKIYKHSRTLDELPTSIVDTKNDLRSSENIFAEWKDIHCKMNNLSKKLRSQIFQDKLLEKNNNSSQFGFHNITGFACKTNKTLSFLAMDSLNYGLVAEKLGITLKNFAHSTAAVIIDGQDESSYLLKEKTISTTSLIEFVYNYTMNKLTRHLRHDQNTKHSHYYRAVNSQSEQNYHPNIDQKITKRKFESIAIPTISAENFTNLLSEPHRTIAVLFISSQCAFCTIFSSILLTVSRILYGADYIQFARIDSDKNDLPWEYTMDLLPAFIVFNNKLESRKYPSDMKVSVQNVLGFILSNLNRSNRLRAIASIVKYRNQQKQSIAIAIGVLRRETEDNIIDSLRAWRLNTRKRNYILRRIQALRRLYFTLYSQASNHDLTKVDELIKEVLILSTHDTSVQ